MRLTAAAMLWHCPADAADRLLKGTITHSDYLPPVPNVRDLGRLYNPQVKHQYAKVEKKRFLVPEWLAGTWQRSQANEISRIQLPANKAIKAAGVQPAVVRDKYGTYRDEKGQVWQEFSPARASGQIDRGEALDFHQVARYELLTTGPASCVVEVHATHTVVNKKTHRVVSLYQDEELNRYSKIADGKIKTDSSVKVFNMYGAPLLLTRSLSDEVRISPFGAKR